MIFSDVFESKLTLKSMKFLYAFHLYPMYKTVYSVTHTLLSIFIVTGVERQTIVLGNIEIVVIEL